MDYTHQSILIVCAVCVAETRGSLIQVVTLATIGGDC